MQSPALSRAVPIAVGMVVLMAGAFQFTAWKARQLRCCRQAPDREPTANARSAWRHGLDLGIQCGRCCANLTAVLLVLGVMELQAMAVVTVAITVERLGPARESVAHVVGAVLIVAGVFLTLLAGARA